jgi:hypothetical protein
MLHRKIGSVKFFQSYDATWLMTDHMVDDIVAQPLHRILTLSDACTTTSTVIFGNGS